MQLKHHICTKIKKYNKNKNSFKKKRIGTLPISNGEAASKHNQILLRFLFTKRTNKCLYVCAQVHILKHI